MRCGVSLLFVIGVTPVTPASAQQVAAPPAQQASGPWSGKAALGYLATGGNTESSSFVVEWGASNTYFESISAISAQLVGDLALVASYAIKNNSDVPLGSERTDTFTALSLEVTF
ncbi:MAG: DUF481 domain-containing protein [Woeseia sp.]